MFPLIQAAAGCGPNRQGWLGWIFWEARKVFFRFLALRKQMVEELPQLIITHRAEKFEEFSPSIHLRKNLVHLNDV